jgi:hypothetical protein
MIGKKGFLPLAAGLLSLAAFAMLSTTGPSGAVVAADCADTEGNCTTTKCKINEAYALGMAALGYNASASASVEPVTLDSWEFDDGDTAAAWAWGVGFGVASASAGGASSSCDASGLNPEGLEDYEVENMTEVIREDDEFDFETDTTGKLDLNKIPGIGCTVEGAVSERIEYRGNLTMDRSNERFWFDGVRTNLSDTQNVTINIEGGEELVFKPSTYGSDDNLGDLIGIEVHAIFEDKQCDVLLTT